MALSYQALELEHQFLQDRISAIEDHLSKLNYRFGLYLQETASLRDSGDKLASSIRDFASKEAFNRTLRIALSFFSDIVCAIQDYRDTQAKRLHHKVIVELNSYEDVCKKAKDEMRKNIAASEKHSSKQNQAEKVKDKSPEKSLKAERNADKARTEAKAATGELSRLIDTFERKKVEDLKRIFLDFVHIELLFHTKALELYSKAYRSIHEIKVDEDVQEFRNQFRLTSNNESIEDILLSHDHEDKDSNRVMRASTPKVNSLETELHCDETVPKSCRRAVRSHNTIRRRESNKYEHTENSSPDLEETEIYKSFKWTY